MTHSKNRTGREPRKPKKVRPQVKPTTPAERIPGKLIVQQRQQDQ